MAKLLGYGALILICTALWGCTVRRAKNLAILDPWPTQGMLRTSGGIRGTRVEGAGRAAAETSRHMEADIGGAPGAVLKGGPFRRTAKATAVTAVFRYTGLVRFFLSPKTQKTRCFTLKMPECGLDLLFPPCGRMLPEWWMVCRHGRGKPNLIMGAVRALCRKPPVLDAL